MSKLLLRFGNSVLQETPVGERGVSIGRAPEDGIVIDNGAVSHHHARVYFGPSGKLVLEDLGSLNGTFVNGQRVGNVTLKPGDSISIGKHNILVESSCGDMQGFAVWRGAPKPVSPKVAETMILSTKDRAALMETIAATGESSQPAPARMKVPSLYVRKGRTDQKEYLLTDKLTVIGKSPMATVKLKRWFAPKVAGQITRRADQSYYLGVTGKAPCLNGWPIARPTELIAGDLIEVAGAQFEFGYRD